MNYEETDRAFSDFLRLIVKTENTLKVVDKAIGCIAPLYGIARVDAEFVVEESTLSFAPEHISETLYDSKKMFDGGDSVRLERTTGESANAVIVAFREAGFPVWTEEQKGQILNIFGILTLAFARMRLIQRLRTVALTEPMTGLPNAAGFIDHLKKLQSFGTLTLYNGYYMNLKNFGLVNRRFGKDETDRIIIRYSEELAQFVDHEECVGRLGGDNFVALIRKSRTEEFLEYIKGVETYGVIDGEEIPIVIQAITGGVEINGPLDDVGSVIGQSAIALNVAKNFAKVPFMFATSEMNTSIFKQKQIGQAFPAALNAGEFKVFYQPKVDTDSNRIVGAEALVRWLNKGKIIPPADFLPVIEEDGSICKLDFYVFETVCQDLKRWQAEGIEPVRVSTNFSRKNLSDPGFADKIEELVHKYDVSKEFIEVEITETTDEAENGLLSKFMYTMHEKHIFTAIDDFGTGYSSLNILRDFPVDVLKLDKSFIDNHTNTDRDNVVLANVVKMAKELDMSVVTEGVERWDQVQFLKDINVNLVQGYLFDKPMPEETFKKRLKARVYEKDEINEPEV